MLEILAEKHNLWLKFLNNLGCDNSFAEDLVQEMYIRLNDRLDDIDKIINDRGLNTYFVYIVLRNMYISHLRKNRAHIYPYLEYDVADTSCSAVEAEMESAYFTYLNDKLKDAVNSLSQHERIMYDLHFVKGKPQREIARDSKVGLSSVNNTCKNIKRVLRIALLEDLEDYYNEEYHLKY